MMTDDIFAKIIAREIPAEILYEDGDTIVVLDIRPNNPGHALVISKKSVLNILDADEATYLAVMKTVHRIAPILKKVVGADGINVYMNNEAAAGQVVPHLHVHVIPRHEGDGLMQWHGKPYEAGEAEQVAARIRAALA